MRYAVDVKAMRINRYQFGRNYMNEYHSHFPISPPEEDLDARLALYSLRRFVPVGIYQSSMILLIGALSYLHESTLFVSEPKHRQECVHSYAYPSSG